MIWLTWRQYRVHFLVGLGVAALFAAYLLYLGYSIRHAYTTDVLGCVAADGCTRSTAEHTFLDDFVDQVLLSSVLVCALPLLLGLFWGAPLVAKEFETNTHKLVWNQSVTRTRWIAAKLAVVGVLSLAVTGVLSTLLTWAASRYDQLDATRFGALSFASRNVAPVGYVAVGLVLGVVVGLFVRRTVPAMAITLAILVTLGVVLPTLVRPHLRTPVSENVAFDGTFRDKAQGLSISRDGPSTVEDYAVPGALMLTSATPLLTASDKEIRATDVQDCLKLAAQMQQGPVDGPAGPDPMEACLITHDLHIAITYQPADRYWPFQWIELAGSLVLAALLSGLVFWRIRHVRG